MVINKEEFLKSLNGRGYLGNRGCFDKGPEGLGDPNDKTLYEIEEKVVIPSFARDIVLRDYCNIENQEFEKCKQNSQFYNRFYTCSEHKRTLKSCMKNWLSKLDLKEQATTEYLEERRLFRMTGLTKQERENYLSPKEKIAGKILDKFRAFILNEEEMKQYEQNKDEKK